MLQSHTHIYLHLNTHTLLPSDKVVRRKQFLGQHLIQSKHLLSCNYVLTIATINKSNNFCLFCSWLYMSLILNLLFTLQFLSVECTLWKYESGLVFVFQTTWSVQNKIQKNIASLSHLASPYFCKSYIMPQINTEILVNGLIIQAFSSLFLFNLHW